MHAIAGALKATMPAQVDLDDLRSAGYIGLIEAADAFDSTRGTPFGAYARTRIHFAMVDYLRSRDMLTRRERRRVRAGTLAFVELQFGHEPDTSDAPCATLRPDALLARTHLSPKLRRAIGQLPARERRIVVEHCLQGRRIADLAADLGITEGRVSQLKTRAIARLRRVVAHRDVAAQQFE